MMAVDERDVTVDCNSEPGSIRDDSRGQECASTPPLETQAAPRSLGHLSRPDERESSIER
jgi:hypothetical protein